MTNTTAIFGSVTSHTIDISSWIHWRPAWGFHIHIWRPYALPPRPHVKAAFICLITIFYIKWVNFTTCTGQTTVKLVSRECHKYNFSSVIHFSRSWSSKWKNKTYDSWYVWQCVHIYVNYQPSSWLSWINSGPMESWKSHNSLYIQIMQSCWPAVPIRRL